MRVFYPLHFWLIFLWIVGSAAVSAGASDQAIELPRPYDKTGHALDIMVHKDVIRDNYGRRLYQKHCQKCHGEHRAAIARAPLTSDALKSYRTISALYPVILRGCETRGGSRFDTLGRIKAIFLARYIKSPIK
jgi:mono/diheme cytochrome c family protein